MLSRIESLLIAISAREHVLLVGPPGWGKTKTTWAVLAEVFGEGGFGVIEFAPNTPPEVVSGAVDVAEYLQSGRLVISRVGTPHDQQISAWLFDEISRANEAALDALLPVLDPPQGRHMVTVATANWWPRGQRFEALASRFAVWIEWKTDPEKKHLLDIFRAHALAGQSDPVIGAVRQHVADMAPVAWELFESGPSDEEKAQAVQEATGILARFLDLLAMPDDQVVALLGLGGMGEQQVQNALATIRERLTPRLERQWARLLVSGVAFLVRANNHNIPGAVADVWVGLLPLTLPAPSADIRAVIADLFAQPLGGGARTKVRGLLEAVWRQFLDEAQGQEQMNVMALQAVIEAAKNVEKDAQAAGVAATQEWKEEMKTLQDVLGAALRGTGWQALVPDWVREVMPEYFQETEEDEE